MPRRIARLTLAMVLTLCLGLAFLPLGCGGSQRDAPAVLHSHRGGEGPTVPDATVSAFRACAEQGKDRLKEDMYSFQFNVAVTESGHAERVKLKGSSPGNGAMESCIGRALENMSVPMFVVQALLVDANPSQARGSMGFVMVLGGAIALVPALVVAAGVTVLVGVTIYLSKEVTETIRQRRKRIAKCTNMFDKCQDIAGECTRKFHKGLDLCGVCRDKCQDKKDYPGKCYSCGFDDP